MKTSCPKLKRYQKGGGSSDYRGLFNASSPSNIQKYGCYMQKGINNAPMFKGLSGGTFPDGITGVIPTGAYYLAQGQNGGGCGCRAQIGGAKRKMVKKSTKKKTVKKTTKAKRKVKTLSPCGNRKIHIGPRGGRYIIKKRKKVYV